MYFQKEIDYKLKKTPEKKCLINYKIFLNTVKYISTTDDIINYVFSF